jgi:hypothetical protein
MRSGDLELQPSESEGELKEKLLMAISKGNRFTSP